MAKLINHVLDIRRLIQQAFDNRFSRMGLRPDEAIAAENLPAGQRERRAKLDNIMANHFKELGNYAEARQVTINECVFTLFNRIAAMKVMESKELFPEVIRRRKENGGRSFEHNAWLENNPSERNAEREGLKHFLLFKFDELGENIPLYRADYPYALMPTADELYEIIERFNAVEEDPECGRDVWRGDDILGWLYENFNKVEKEALKTSGDKIEHDKVSLQSQVYTPQWVVKFLVTNTLGKLYLEMFPDSEIRRRYQIANAPTNRTRQVKDVRELKVLDPACGSGNFLIFAFQFLYELYLDQIENYGLDISRRDIPKMIVEQNLFGVDLDERAAQLSQIALFIKARELGGHRSKWPRYTNVVSAHFFLPEYADIRDTFDILGSWSQKQVATIELIWNDLCNAYKFGSLIRVEERLNSLMPENDEPMLFGNDQFDNLFSFKNNITNQLQQQVAQWSGKGSNPYTLAKTSEAIDFLNIISQKYDVVVANPPYTDSGDFGTELKEFVENNYKKPFKCNSNLYACFIKRCCELAGTDGKVGMIHPHTFMFIKTFEEVRKFMLEQTHINVMVDYGLDRVNLFGPGILLDATFYTLDITSQDKTDGVYFNITANQQEKFKKGSLEQAYSDFINGIPNDRVYTIPQSKLKGIKSYPFIYWISDEFREKFIQGSLSKMGKVLSGLKTGNNEATVRYWWEVTDFDKWSRMTKGGPFNRWYGNTWTRVITENDFELIKQQNSFSIPTVRDIECITFPTSGSGRISFRMIDADTIYNNASNAINCDDNKLLLAVLNSKMSDYAIGCLNPTVNTTVGDIQRIPLFDFDKIDSTVKEYIHNSVDQNISIKKYLYQYSLIEENFKRSPIGMNFDATAELLNFFSKENALLTQVLLNEVILNKYILDEYHLSEPDLKMVLDKEGIPVGDLPVSPEAKVSYKEWLATNSKFPASAEVLAHLDDLEERTDIPRVDDFDTLYTNNKEWEEFCIQHNINPVEVWYQFMNAKILPPPRTQILAFELLTDVIRTVLANDDDGVIPLGDKMGEERLAIRIEREFMERGYSAAQFNQVCQLLGCELEKYLQERFFQQLSDHLNLFMYLPKTPFIWHLSSGEHHALELFVSIYKWNRDALFRVRSIYVANRETAIRDRLNSIDTSKTEGRLEANELRAMLTELNEYCQKIDNLLASGYDPKLDDGVGKNIAPLQKRGMISYEVLNDSQLKKYLNADW